MLSEGFQIGLKNFLPLFLAWILYILTCWIPYLNVGTTIAMLTLPIEFSKDSNKTLSPTFLFDGKYRKYMGEFFTLIGLMFMSLLPAYLFFIAPGIIISIGWSLALYLMIDKEVSPSDSLIMSNKITYGYKLTIFGISFFLTFALQIAVWLVSYLFGLMKLGTVGLIVSLVLLAVFAVANVGCQAVIYRNLSRRLSQ